MFGFSWHYHHHHLLRMGYFCPLHIAIYYIKKMKEKKKYNIDVIKRQTTSHLSFLTRKKKLPTYLLHTRSDTDFSVMLKPIYLSSIISSSSYVLISTLIVCHLRNLHIPLLVTPRLFLEMDHFWIFSIQRNVSSSFSLLSVTFWC